MRSKNVSHAVVFLDFRQAFYAVFRQFLTKHSHSPEGFLSFCSSMGVPEEHARTILQTLDLLEDAITAGLASHLKRRLGDALQNTWFSVRDAPSPIATAKGTRPGDPLADILFALILAFPLKRLNALLRETGLTPIVTTGGVLPGTSVAEAPGPSSACWHDNVILLVASERCEDLLEACAAATRLAQSCFAATGLVVNFAAGKTEVVATPLGTGRRNTLSAILDSPDVSLPLDSNDASCQSVRLVSAYKHLGSMLQDDGGLRCDVDWRLQSARKGLAPLARPIFGRSDVAPKAKADIFSTLIISRLAHNVGVWGALSPTEANHWSAGVFGLYRSLAPRALRQAAAHLSAAQLCEFAAAPAPLAIVNVLRLRLLDQIAGTACAGLLQLLDASVGHSRCWLTAVLSDVQWARSRLPAKHFACRWSRRW